MIVQAGGTPPTRCLTRPSTPWVTSLLQHRLHHTTKAYWNCPEPNHTIWSQHGAGTGMPCSELLRLFSAIFCPLFFACIDRHHILDLGVWPINCFFFFNFFNIFIFFLDLWDGSEGMWICGLRVKCIEIGGLERRSFSMEGEDGGKVMGGTGLAGYVV